MALHTLRQTALKAARMYKTASPGEKPDLVDPGLESLRKIIGGYAGGNLVIIGAATNVGKTSIATEMLIHSTDRGVLLSREDQADILGLRLITRGAAVKERSVRTNELDPKERDRVMRAIEDLPEDSGPLIALPDDVRNLDRVDRTIDEAAGLGARWAILDYLQKYRGISDNRRAEVGLVMDRFQTKCREHDIVPIIVSQLGRLGKFTVPKLSDLKESGDIENEAKFIMLAHCSPSCPARVIVEVAKSSYGGGGTKLSLKYDEFGVLREEGLYDVREEIAPGDLPEVPF